MPLTTKGKTKLREFQNTYGKEKGSNVFYGYMKKFPMRVKTWHRKK